MEPVLLFSYYTQLREHSRSAINCSATLEHEAHPHQDRRLLICGTTLPDHLTESIVRNTQTQENPTSAGPVDLDDAFEAMTEEIDFDWPEFPPVDRIRTGLIQVTLGLILFLVLIGGVTFLHQSYIHQRRITHSGSTKLIN